LKTARNVSLAPKVELDIKNINIPPALLGDSNKLSLFANTNNSLRNFDIDECFEELYRGQKWVERFSEACI
jgi:hypothetical protein